MKKVILGIGVLAIMAGCATNNAKALKKKSTEFTFEVSTTPCFGTCPVYDLTIKESGLAVYNGKKFPETKGELFKNLPDQEMDSLRDIHNRHESGSPGNRRSPPFQKRRAWPLKPL